MAVLPDKLLSEKEISDFIDRVNQRSDEILGENKFKIPSPELPGVGLLIKLQIRAFEKSIASFLAPVFLAKGLITKARQSLNFFKTLKEGFNDIKKIFTNPLQFILDEGINSVLAQFPFPIAILFGEASKNLQKLKGLIDGASSVTGESVFSEYDYDLILNSNQVPQPGQLTSPAQKISDITSVKVNYQTKVTGENSPVDFLVPGDNFVLTDSTGVFGFSVSQVRNENTFSEIFLQLKSQDSPTSPSKTLFVPGFGSKSLRLAQSVLLREFLTPDGKLIIPFSVLGINLPLLSSLSFEIGNFSRLKDDNPIKAYVTLLENNSGLKFTQILAGMFDGVFPALDWNSIQNPNSKEYRKQLASEELVSLSRLIQIGTSNPFFLIKILLNYFKLLLLPLQVVLGVLKGLAQKVSGPFSLIQFVFQIISNPLKALCSLISTAFLEFLRPFVEPSVSAIIPWSELVQDPNDKTRGLKPLFTDLVCGNFEKNLRSYQPSATFFRNQFNSLNTPANPPQQIQLPFDLSINGIPSSGEITKNSEDLKAVTVIKISEFTNTVENSLPFLAGLKPGELVSFSENEVYQDYIVSSKFFRINPAGNYFEIFVQPLSTLQSGIAQQVQNQSTVSQNFKASLSVNNPNKTFLLIVEKYLPVKAIAVWESVKGILSITIALASEMPSLIPAVFRSLFSDGQNLSQSQILLGSTLDLVVSLYEGDPGILDGSSGDSLKRNISDEEKADIIKGSQEALSAIIGNDSAQNYEGIDTIFYNLQEARALEGKSIYVTKNRIQNLAERQKFRFDSLSISKLGINLKVLLSIYNLILSQNDRLAPKNLSLNVYGSNGTNSFLIYSGDLYPAFLQYRIIEQTPSDTQNRFNVESMRNVIEENLRYTGIYLLPTLNS
jgi:hypothetical protein